MFELVNDPCKIDFTTIAMNNGLEESSPPVDSNVLLKPAQSGSRHRHGCPTGRSTAGTRKKCVFCTEAQFRRREGRHPPSRLWRDTRQFVDFTPTTPRRFCPTPVQCVWSKVSQSCTFVLTLGVVSGKKITNTQL